MAKETQPEQSTVSRLIEVGYTEFKIFHRKDCLNYDCGYGIFTGEFRSNCDGITLKFTDGTEFLSDFCILQDTNNPQLMWDITKEIASYSSKMRDNVIKMELEYANLK